MHCAAAADHREPGHACHSAEKDRRCDDDAKRGGRQTVRHAQQLPGNVYYRLGTPCPACCVCFAIVLAAVVLHYYTSLATRKKLPFKRSLKARIMPNVRRTLNFEPSCWSDRGEAYRPGRGPEALVRFLLLFQKASGTSRTVPNITPKNYCVVVLVGTARSVIVISKMPCVLLRLHCCLMPTHPPLVPSLHVAWLWFTVQPDVVNLHKSSRASGRLWNSRVASLWHLTK